MSDYPGRRVDLPGPRDQIETKELPEFVHLRTEVSRLVRSREEPATASGTLTTDADPHGR